MRIFVGGMWREEAYLFLQYWLDDGRLEDPAVDYLAERVDEMDAAALLEALALIKKRLTEIQVLEGMDTGERIRITKDFRILLPERFDTEVRLRPLVKTVFLLFLRHPEGIRFGNLQDYRKELTELYMGISPCSDAETARERIARLTDPRDNSIHEKAANLSAALSKYFKPARLPAYTITGKAGTPKRIRLDRALVEWE